LRVAGAPTGRDYMGMVICKIFAGLAALSLLTGCGGGSPSPGTKSSPPNSANTANAASVFTQVAKCIRANGQPNFPDPVQAKDGTWGFPEEGSRVKIPEACATVYRQSKALYPNRPKGPTVTPEELAKARRLARCMRQNGISDWPDPNADGTFTLPNRLAQPKDEPIWQPAASGACKQYKTAGGPIIVGPSPR
jgi:hypothetical protein